MMGNNGEQHATATFVVIISKYATTLYSHPQQGRAG